MKPDVTIIPKDMTLVHYIMKVLGKELGNQLCHCWMFLHEDDIHKLEELYKVPESNGDSDKYFSDILQDGAWVTFRIADLSPWKRIFMIGGYTFGMVTEMNDIPKEIFFFKLEQ